MPSMPGSAASVVGDRLGQHQLVVAPVSGLMRYTVPGLAGHPQKVIGAPQNFPRKLDSRSCTLVAVRVVLSTWNVS